MAKKKEKNSLVVSHIDAIADRVAITDLKGNIRDINQAMMAFHGRRREEIVGRNFLDLVLEEDRDMIRQCFAETLERGFSKTTEYRSRDDRGEVIYSEVNAVVIRDAAGRPFEAVAVIRDVSHRKAIEKRLAEREEMYRNLIENIREAVYKIDENGAIVFISSGIERISGYKSDELCGSNFSEFIYQEDLQHIREQFGRLMKNILEPDEYRIVCKNGDVRWISSSSRPIFANGRFCGLNGIMTDIHERKIAQQALQNQQELLQQAQKMEAIGTLASGIAHDFNNLLMGIQGRASLLLMESEAGRPEYEHLKGIEQYIKSAAELTQQLLGLARGGKYEVMPADLNDLIQQHGRNVRAHQKGDQDIHQAGPGAAGSSKWTAPRSSRCCSISWSMPGRPCPTAATLPSARRMSICLPAMPMFSMLRRAVLSGSGSAIRASAWTR